MVASEVFRVMQFLPYFLQRFLQSFVQYVSSKKLRAYWQLMRFHRPVGIFLLLWPTYWAMWLAAEGVPHWSVWAIFTLGVVVMRAAGCVINDYADRHVDGHVQRTNDRPLVSGQITPNAALALFFVLILIAFVLVLLTNTLTLLLSVGALVLAACYPFMKRYTHLPQVVLGAAFSCSIPMAFAAQNNTLDPTIWLVYTTNLLWVVVYDTFYSMVDRADDLKIGVKSTAILFAENDRVIIALLQGLTVLGWLMMAGKFELGPFYTTGVLVAAGLFCYQQWLIRSRKPKGCFDAFKNNNWVGASIFIGIALHYMAG